MARTKKVKTIMGAWIDELVRSTGQHIRLETRDGVVREGRLSGLRSRTIKWNGKGVEILEEVELNGDPYDVVPLNRIATFDLL